MIGKTIGGRYEIINQLGEGGCGETYLAKDKQRPKAPRCVVKRLKPQNINPTYLRLFEQEAEILEYLGKHDQIPQLLAHFTENQELYLVQELIDGRDLRHELLPGRQWSETEAIALLQGILEVLKVVHQHNAIHRDIKPSNIMRREKDGKIVLIDFGAVKQISSQRINAQGQVTLTIPIGTPPYMPLEQVRGRPQLSSDIYAVGTIGIQALTGMSYDQLPTAIDVDRILSAYRVKLNTKLAKILDKMVCFDYQQRYPSANEALQAIAALTTQNNRRENPKLLSLGVIVAFTVGLMVAFIPQIKQICCQPPVDLADYSWLSQNSDYGIKMKYPKNWSIESGAYPSAPDLSIFQSPEENYSDTFREMVIINVVELEKPILLNEFTKELINGIKQHLTDFKLFERCETEIILAGGKTQTACYAGKESGRSLKYMLAVTLSGDRAYYVTYIAEPEKYERFLKPVKDMIKSVQIIESQ